MPQRKRTDDPDPPGARAGAVARRVGRAHRAAGHARKVEEKIGENARVEKIESNTRTGPHRDLPHAGGQHQRRRQQEFDDIKLKLDWHPRPAGRAGPINFVKDFGDTAGADVHGREPEGRR